MKLSPLYGGRLTSLISCGSWAGNHHCCEPIAKVVLSCAEDTVVFWTSSMSGSCMLMFPLLIWSFIYGKRCNIYIPFVSIHSHLFSVLLKVVNFWINHPLHKEASLKRSGSSINLEIDAYLEDGLLARPFGKIIVAGLLWEPLSASNMGSWPDFW